MTTDIAIVHDYLTQRGGAERVLLSMVRAFPDAPVYTSLFESERTYPDFRDVDLRPLWTNMLGPLRRDHRRGLPLYPFAFGGLKVDAEVVLCSSSGFAHGVRTSGKKIVYCYTPARWLYSEADTYLEPWPQWVTLALGALAPALRSWDQRAARSAERYLTSSSVVRERIRQVYGVDAVVLPPGVKLDLEHHDQDPLPDRTGPFVLCVSRLLGYKNVALVVEAFRLLPEVDLLIVGEGPERPLLESRLPSNVTLLGSVSEPRLRWLYANCDLLVAASYEDFGLTPLEAATFGRPAAVFGAGGYLDTVVPGVTGRFFDDLSPQSIAETVSALQAEALPPAPIIEHVKRFSDDVFRRELVRVVDECRGATAGPPPP